MPSHVCWTDLIKLILGFLAVQIPLPKEELDIILGLWAGLQVWPVLTGLLVSVLLPGGHSMPWQISHW